MAKSTGAIAMNTDWRTQEDLSTIRRAEEIKADKTRLAAVRRLAEKEQKALQALTNKPSAKPGTAKKKRG